MSELSPERIYKILVISAYRTIVHTRAEAELFIRLAAEGHLVHVITVPNAEYKARMESFGITVFEDHPTKKISFEFIRHLRHRIKQYGYDFVHVFNSKGLTNAVWALIGCPSKLIAYRGYAGQTHWYDPMMYLKYFHPRVDQIMCVSKDIEDILARHMIRGRRKLTTIRKGHDPAWYRDIVPIERSRFNIPENAILVCFLANNRPFKGLRYLIEASYLLSPDLPLAFMFIGEGYDDPDTKEAMESSPFSKSFHKLGFQENPLPFLAASDCLISASTHGEGLSKSIVEAMSLGVAPIITKIGGNDGLVEDGISGWVIPPKNSDAIASALTDMATHEEERKRRGEAARLHIEKHFHIEKSVEALKTLYQKLLGTNPN